MCWGKGGYLRERLSAHRGIEKANEAKSESGKASFYGPAKSEDRLELPWKSDSKGTDKPSDVPGRHGIRAEIALTGE